MNLNPGIYRGRAAGHSVPEHVRWGVAESGNQQIAVKFILLDESGQDTPDVIWWVGTFSDKANEKGTTATQITLKALRNCGWRGDQVDNLVGLEDDVVELDVQEEEDLKGVMRSRVKWVNRPGNGFNFKRQLNTSDVKALSQRVKGALLALDKKDPPAPVKGVGSRAAASPLRPSSAGQQQATGTDDDIPF